ncbi:MAG: hypothetical protein L6R41_002379 [Letrouitia leprolyta]|nr:MAG: hypothetical protein L6R41_002379 [Letrouitia leprolyta]
MTPSAVNRNRRKMANTLSAALKRGKAFLTPTSSSTNVHQLGQGFAKAPEGSLFPKVDPELDGEDCEHDCESCTIRYPSKFKIDEDEKLYGHVNGWATHMLVATGKTDWVRDVSDEKGSVMEAVRDCGVEPNNGVCTLCQHASQLQEIDNGIQKLMLSASNIPTPEDHHSYSDPTTILLLPSFTIIENVTPKTVPTLIEHHVNTAPTSTTPFPSNKLLPEPPTASEPSSNPASVKDADLSTPPPPILLTPSPFTTRPCPHQSLILLCSQRTRDARCGQSAPLLRREFERHLRPLGLYRDLHDERPGGVGIYFISHVGGHKFSANVMVYRRTGSAGADGSMAGDAESGGDPRDVEMGEGSQCIWLARVRPEDCEGIVKFTVLKGKVVKPERQLRGGFDREKGLVSW